MRRVYYRAAGGIVIHNKRVLLLDRPSRSEVRLPKGHIEKGETPAEAALREVREETGYERLAIVADLGTDTVEFYDPYRKRQVVRDERYYLMRLEGEQQIEPTVREGQFVPIWLPAQRALDQLSFAAEREFLRRGLLWLDQRHGR